MTKDEFEAKTKILRDYISANVKKEEGFAFVLLTEANNNEKGLTYSDIISNIRPEQVPGFCTNIINIAKLFMGRQN